MALTTLCVITLRSFQSVSRGIALSKGGVALLLALQHFEVYLGGNCNPIIVYTDHNPLVFCHEWLIRTID